LVLVDISAVRNVARSVTYSLYGEEKWCPCCGFWLRIKLHNSSDKQTLTKIKTNHQQQIRKEEMRKASKTSSIPNGFNKNRSTVRIMSIK
jgi:hypothetical protein